MSGPAPEGTRRNEPCRVRIDVLPERLQKDPVGFIWIELMTKRESTGYRFSDVVRGIGTTPKSFRRWLITLGIESKGGGWHSFAPGEVVEFAIMRHLVDWGVSVVDAANLSVGIMARLLAGVDPSQIDHERFAELVAASDLPQLQLQELVLRLQHRQVFVHRLDGELLTAYAQGGDAPPAGVGAQGSFLTLRLAEIALGVWQALHRSEDR